MTAIDISQIRVNGGTQSRAGINLEVVADYAELVKSGTVFPPVIVFFDGWEYWLADGFHRYEAYAKAGIYKIPADIRQGSQRDAILFSVGANASHGLRRTRDDKRRAVLTLLNDPEWSQWSDREIARQCGVSHEFVRRSRPATVNVDSEHRAYTTKHGSTATMNTANIGGGSKSDQNSLPASAPAQPVVTQVEPDAGERDSAAPDTAPSDADQNEISADEVKARRELAKLTDEALIDEIIGLRAENADLRKRTEAIERERDDLKATVRDLSADNQGATISRIKKELVAVKFARDNAQTEVKRMEYRLKKAEERVAELESTGFEIAV